ncbi:MAG: sulfotransferase [Bacteroidota bacterium]|nr:sulfotransferase [Bacteroidota bacterium]
MKRPGFFIVGAPKCGTTAMNNYLAQHPAVFMAKKELHYFGSDLKIKDKISEAEYLHYFENAGDEKIIGEASVWYLFSKNAAREIKDFSPGAKILIMLRDPVEMLHSLHSQHLFNANEDVGDFEKAIALDDKRRRGKHLADSLDFFELPLYRDTAMFADQVKRYLDIFGKENVHIILYEDFKDDTKKAVAETLAFLGLNEETNIKFKRINPNKKIKFLRLHRMLKYPSAGMKKIARIILPVKKLRHELMVLLFKINTRETKRKKMEEKVNNELRIFLSEDIKKLSLLINHDLSKWLP